MKLNTLNTNKMKDNKLISMVEFVQWQDSKTELHEGTLFQNCRRYAKFLQQPLTLGMFVPCVDGVPIEDPNRDDERYFGDWGLSNWSKDNHAYKKAKDKVLFDGFELTVNVHGIWVVEKSGSGVSSESNLAVEYLTKFKPTLTKTAIKQIGL